MFNEINLRDVRGVSRDGSDPAETTAAIQTAINDLASPGTLIVPRGVYALDAGLGFDVEHFRDRHKTCLLVERKRNISIEAHRDAWFVLEQVNERSSKHSPCVLSWYKSTGHITGLNVRGEGRYRTHAADGYDPEHDSWSGCGIYVCRSTVWGTGLHAEDCQNGFETWIADGSRWTDCKATGSLVLNGFLDYNSRELWIDGCTVDPIVPVEPERLQLGMGIYLNANVDSVGQRVTNCTVRNVWYECIVMEGSGWCQQTTIRGNTLEHAQWGVIARSGNGIEVAGNKIENCRGGGLVAFNPSYRDSSHGYLFGNQVNGVLCHHNHLVNCGSNEGRSIPAIRVGDIGTHYSMADHNHLRYANPEHGTPDEIVDVRGDTNIEDGNIIAYE